MASSDEEGEICPDSVTNYHFVSSKMTLVSFSVLPLHWNDEVVFTENGESLVVYLLGSADGGLQSVYKQVIGWKFELSYPVPEVYVRSTGNTWIQLQKPRKSYEETMKSVLIAVHCLHFAKRNYYATGKEITSHLMKTLSSYDLLESLEKYLSDHLPLIKNAVANDEDLAKSEYLEAFLMEIENPGRKTLHEKETESTRKPKFVVSDDEDEDEDEDDNDLEDEDELFDSVCAFCDNGGDVLPCEGQCMRSFHPTIVTGVDTCCESIGFSNAAQYEAVAVFLCDNCKHKRHQCFVCGVLGSSDKSSAEVFPCVSATCGHFYHPNCVANLLYPSNKTLASELESQIAEGKSFTCPIHKCHHCEEGEDKDVPELQFAVCRRCPKAYHRKCLPKEILFKGNADGTIQQRAWDGLLPNRILMYCTKHPIIAKLTTPKRDHLLFPSIVRKRNQDGSRTEVVSERRSNAFGNYKVAVTERMPKAVERRSNAALYGDIALGKGRSFPVSKMTSSFQENKPIPRNLAQPSNTVRTKLPYKEMHKEQEFTSKPVKKMAVTTPPKVDAEMKSRILKLMEDSISSFDFEEYIKEKTKRCTHEIYTPQHGLDKTITLGKVEASVQAVRTALKKLEDGGSVEDAKAVCEPNVLNQLIRWKKKLHVYLAPFLIGARYTSFGRHFTKVHKLEEIVNRLHWYVEDGDTIVDFCCGSNDFSCLMKEKLDSTGKKCNFKNYDLITPKNTFNFEKRDWFSVPVGALPDGSGLVMGLNPPFGVRASLANKFIQHALKFKPKLIILIVPEETRRLDYMRYPYDLIWEDHDMFSGKSFYLPGSVDIKDQPLDDWNVRPPPLSLWSRPDWTAKHLALARKHSHIESKQPTPPQQTETIPSDCIADFCNLMTNYSDITALLDDVPEEPDNAQPIRENTNIPSHILDAVAANMDLSGSEIPLNHSGSEPMRFNPPCIQPGQRPGFAPPQYANTSDPYRLGDGFRYPQSGHYANFDHPAYGYPGGASNYGQPNYGQRNYSQRDFSTQAYSWPPGAAPPGYRYN